MLTTENAENPKKSRYIQTFIIMKKIMVALTLCLVSVVSFSQEVKIIAETLPLYQGVVTTDITASTLYNQSKLWIAEAFRSAQNVIQYDNADEATILVKGNTNIGKGLKMAKVHFALKIEGKENRFRYTIEVSDITGISGQGLTQSIMNFYLKNEKYRTWVDTEMHSTIMTWINEILSSSSNSSNNDW